MGYSDLDPAVHERRPWNAGQNVGPKRPLKPRDIWAIRFYLDEHKRLRDRALFDLAIDSKLRGCDLVKIRIGDVVSGSNIRNRSTVIQQKTGRPVQFEIMSEARKSLTAWLERRQGTIQDFVFPSRIDYLGHLSTRQYARLVDEWVSTVGLDKREYGTHSLRRTKASLIYKAASTFGWFRSCWGIPTSRTRCGIWVSTSTTHCRGDGRDPLLSADWFAAEILPRPWLERWIARQFSREGQLVDIVQESFELVFRSADPARVRNARVYLRHTAYADLFEAERPGDATETECLSRRVSLKPNTNLGPGSTHIYTKAWLALEVFTFTSDHIRFRTDRRKSHDGRSR